MYYNLFIFFAYITTILYSYLFFGYKILFIYIYCKYFCFF